MPSAEPLRTVHTPKAKKVNPAPKQRWWLTLVVLAVVGGGGYYYWPRLKPLVAKLTAERAAPAPPPARIIPVVTAVARPADLNLYLNGLGTVTGFKTVTVRSRVEGELIKVGFTEGQMVEEGDLLAEIDPRPFEVLLKELEAQLLKDKSALRVAITDFQRYEALVASKTITEQQLDSQRALVQQAQATVQADQGRLGNIRLQLKYCRITAPFTGRIGLRHVDAGNMVRANDPTGLAVITQLQPIAVVFPIPQDDIARVQQKMNAGKKLVVEAYDRDFKTKLATGTLVAIDNQVDSTTGTLRLKAQFTNKENLLFPNQFVNARLLVETLHDVVLVPSAAIQRGPNSTFVYVVNADSTVDIRPITVGATEGDKTAIESGLAGRETVVIDGVDKLQRGAKVAGRDVGADSTVEAQPKADLKGT